MHKNKGVLAMNIDKELNKVEKTLRLLFILFLAMTILTNVKKIYDSRQDAVYKSNADNSLLQPLSAPSGYIQLELAGGREYPKLEVLINGEFVSSFEVGKKLEIQVKNRDVIEINGTMYSDEIKINVVSVTNNLKESSLEKEVLVKSNIVVLGIARI